MIKNSFSKKRVAIIIIAFMLGLFIGYMWGVQAGVRLAVRIGLGFVDISVDEAMITTAIWQYKNQVGGCLFNENYSWG